MANYVVTDITENRYLYKRCSLYSDLLISPKKDTRAMKNHFKYEISLMIYPIRFSALPT